MAHVLIIDDDPDMAELLGHMLDILSHQHAHVTNLAGAVAACEAHAPDLIILDIMLEGTDGWEVYRALERITPAPIVFITAWRTGENRHRAEALLADGFLAKPISHQDFAAQLQRVLGRKARRHTLAPTMF